MSRRFDPPTVIVAVDSPHIRELALSLPTWAVNVPGIARWPFLFIGDDDDSIRDGREIFGESGIKRVEFARASDILPSDFPAGNAVTQRERMLTALAFAPLRVQTQLFLKLDTDTIALPGDGDGVVDSWCKIHSNTPIAAPRWGYTKPGHWLDTLDRWADRVAPGNAKPYRLPSGGVAKSPRIISYAMLGDTSFARECLMLNGNANRLPVPSQDTFYWYCAALLGREVLRLPTPRIRWRHAGGNMDKLQSLASEAVRT